MRLPGASHTAAEESEPADHDRETEQDTKQRTARRRTTKQHHPDHDGCYPAHDQEGALGRPELDRLPLPDQLQYLSPARVVRRLVNVAGSQLVVEVAEQVRAHVARHEHMMPERPSFLPLQPRRQWLRCLPSPLLSQYECVTMVG